MADRWPAFVAQSLGHVELAQSSIAQKLSGFAFVRKAAALHADLHDALILARGRHHLSTLENVVARGLLAVHIQYTSLPAWQAQIVASACQ
jgi:hypothetical protein